MKLPRCNIGEIQSFLSEIKRTLHVTGMPPLRKFPSILLHANTIEQLLHDVKHSIMHRSSTQF